MSGLATILVVEDDPVVLQLVTMILSAAKMYEVGTRKPDVEFGSPMPKLSVLSHFRMSSSLVYGLSALTMMCE